MRCPTTASIRKGFTLIEIMIAISIISIALVVVSEFQAKTINLTRETINLSLATLLLQERIAAFESGLSSEEEEGDFEQDYPGFTWKKEVIETKNPYLNKMIMTIKWSEGTQERDLSLHYLVYKRS